MKSYSYLKHNENDYTLFTNWKKIKTEEYIKLLYDSSFTSSSEIGNVYVNTGLEDLYYVSTDSKDLSLYKNDEKLYKIPESYNVEIFTKINWNEIYTLRSMKNKNTILVINWKNVWLLNDIKKIIYLEDSNEIKILWTKKDVLWLYYLDYELWNKE